MPRVEMRISVELDPGIDPNTLGNAISNAIRDLTGAPAQVVLNKRDKGISRVNMYSMRQQLQRNNIELMPTGR